MDGWFRWWCSQNEKKESRRDIKVKGKTTEGRERKESKAKRLSQEIAEQRQGGLQNVTERFVQRRDEETSKQIKKMTEGTIDIWTRWMSAGCSASDLTLFK